MKKILILLAIVFSVPAHAALTLLDHNDWKVDFSGFAELDAISDSTRSITEIPGNTPIARPTATNGQVGRMQFSVRNSRLGFAVTAPEFDGWKTRSLIEMDFFGFDLAPSSSGYNSESAYYGSPTLRIRHAYMAGEKDGWKVLAGQTWSILGWQPYYFVPTTEVAPIPAELFSRNAQVHVMKTMGDANGTQWQAIVGAMRPPQRDAGLPGVEAGIRLADNSRKGALTNVTTMNDSTQAMSIAVSAAARRISIPSNASQTTPNGDRTNFNSTAVAADFLLPIIASADGKQTGNNFVIGGDFTMGRGYGDEFNAYTDSQASPISALAVANTATGNTNLDAGIGGYDSNGLFQLIKLQTFSVFGQYHFSQESRTWISGGYSALSSSNANNIANLATASSVGYNRQTASYANIMHNLTTNLRVAFEYSYIQTTYTDTIQNHNNRYQLSSYFFF